MEAEVRRKIIGRAGHRCEYCRLHETHQPLVAFHVEHIVARQHGGDDSPGNLALACQRCNLRKGTNLTGRDPETNQVTRLFHPRQDRWDEHFELRGGEIVGLSAVGRTTAALLRMNSPDRIELRLELQKLGLWE